MHIVNRSLYYELENDGQLKKIIQSYWESLQLETRKVDYDEKQLNELLNMVSSDDQNVGHVAINIIYGMHPKYVRAIYNINKSQSSNDKYDLISAFSKFDRLSQFIFDDTKKLGAMLYPLELGYINYVTDLYTKDLISKSTFLSNNTHYSISSTLNLNASKITLYDTSNNPKSP